jgi:inositol transport system permease protein
MDKVIGKRIDANFIFRRFGIYILLVLSSIISSLLSDTFFTQVNLFNILKQVSIVGIICFGECMLIIAGQIDLSSGAVIATAGVASVIVTNMTGSVFTGILASIGFGLACGFANGFIVTRYKLPAFIITLGTQIFMRGLALQMTNAIAISPESENFKILGQGSMLGIIPNLVVLLLVLLVISWFIMNKTAFGRYLYATGGNEEAAKASGVNISLVKIIAFMFSGLLAGIAGFACASRINVGQPNIGLSGVAFEFDAIIGCVLGGASLAGGVGSVVAGLAGCVFVGILNNILNLLNVSPYLQQMVKGALIILAVVIDAKGKGYGGKQWLQHFLKFGSKDKEKVKLT